MGRPEPAQSAAFLQGLGLMGQQVLQDSQQPGPVVRQLGIEVLDVVAGRDGAVHLHAGGEEQGESRAARPAGIHLPGGLDPVRQFTGTDEGGGEHDLTGEQAMGGGRTEQPQQGVHEGRGRRVLWLLPRRWPGALGASARPHELLFPLLLFAALRKIPSCCWNPRRWTCDAQADVWMAAPLPMAANSPPRKQKQELPS